MPLSDLNQVNPDWLTNTLKVNGHLTQGRAVHVTRDMWKESAYSYITRLQVGYSVDAGCKNGVAPPAALVLKFNRPIGAIRRIPLFAHREFEFYRRIAPVMRNLLSPRCYDTQFELQSGRYHFLLEDLSATHTHSVNPLPPLLSEFEQIIDCLAHLHAAWWNDPHIGVTIGRPFLEERGSRRAATIRKRTDKFLDFLGDRIAGTRRNILLDLRAAYPCLLERQHAGPLTIVHGDAHFENFVVSPDRTDCRIIDWENWEVAPATDDLAYLLAVLCFAAQRQRTEQDLLRRYHRTLIWLISVNRHERFRTP